MWPLDEGDLRPILEIKAQLDRAADSSIEGISVVGGEPFLQAAAVLSVARHAKALDLGVIVFSGFELEALLDDQDDNVRDLLKATDLLIDGPYLEAQRSSQRSWVGSDNQRFHFFTDRYREYPEIRSNTLRSVDIEERPICGQGRY
jgi:anaerobic ribonucleoside-triphosphate reductase activating protein